MSDLHGRRIANVYFGLACLALGGVVMLFGLVIWRIVVDQM